MCFILPPRAKKEVVEEAVGKESRGAAQEQAELLFLFTGMCKFSRHQI